MVIMFRVAVILAIACIPAGVIYLTYTLLANTFALIGV